MILFIKIVFLEHHVNIEDLDVVSKFECTNGIDP